MAKFTQPPAHGERTAEESRGGGGGGDEIRLGKREGEGRKLKCVCMSMMQCVICLN